LDFLPTIGSCAPPEAGPEIKTGFENLSKDFSHLTTRSDCEKEERCFRERIFFKQRWNQKIEIRSPLIDLVFYKCQNDSAKLERFFDVLSYGMNIVTCIEEDEGRSNTSLVMSHYCTIHVTRYTVYHIQYILTVFDVQLLIFTLAKEFLTVKKALHLTL